MNRRFVDIVIEKKNKDVLVDWFHRLEMRGKLHHLRKPTIKLMKKIEDHLWEEHRL